MKKVFVLFLFVCCLFGGEFDSNLSENKIRQMIAKMVILGFDGSEISKDSQIYKDIKSGLGGVILFDKDMEKNPKNITSIAGLKHLTSSLQEAANNRLLIGIDQEGGKVQRLKASLGFIDTPSAMQIAANGKNFARQSYAKLADELKNLGINLNFAPVVDLSLNHENKVIYKLERSFGEDAKTVSEFAKIFISEMKKQGVISVLKHFPGHGSSLGDSHEGFVDISNTWQKDELKPYKMLKKYADVVMTAHVFNEKLDKNYPATLSYKINTKLLRKKIKFKGVLISDDLQMKAISEHFSLSETVKLAINSGVDILLFGNQLGHNTLDEIVNAVYENIANKEIKLKRIIESNKRIDRLVDKYLK